MISLTGARLVNWHYFRDTTLRIGKRTLISGDNGMGKSTIVDAIQYALAADLRKARFNQAAGDRRGGRDLLGYVRCKIGSDSTEYLRGDTVSHVMLRFDANGQSFSAAVCVEAYADGRATERFWIGQGVDIDSVPVRDDKGRSLNWRQFRDRLEGAQLEFHDSKREYLRGLTSRLGVFRRMSEYNPYLEAFTRSVSFTPLVSVD
ncbi:MAG TPA: ATP-binding protein, partial [Spirochaetales bacterium]|nr:ATP-binding protein [Spirochaetales bacterium]